MTALAANMPGPRQRLDPIAGRAGEDAAQDASNGATRDDGRAFAAALGALATAAQAEPVPGGRAITAGRQDDGARRPVLQTTVADPAAVVQTALDALLALAAPGIATGPGTGTRAAATDADGRSAPNQQGQDPTVTGAAQALAAALASCPAQTAPAGLPQTQAIAVTPEATAASLTATAAPAPVPAADGSRGLAAPEALASMPVHVVDQKTHFAPVLPAGPQPAVAATSGQGTPAAVPPDPVNAATAVPAALSSMAATLPKGAPTRSAVASPGTPPASAQASIESAEPAASAREEASAIDRQAGPPPAPRPAGPSQRGGDERRPAEGAAEIAASRTGEAREAPGRTSRAAVSPDAATALPAAVRAEAGALLQLDRPATALPGSTLVQIADAIAAEVPAAATPAAVPEAAKAPEGPLRLLTLQLQPAELGALVIRLRLQGEQLNVGLHAERASTADLLHRDEAALSELLRGAGYRPDIAAIQPGSGAGASLGDGTGRGPSSFPSMAGGQNPGGSTPDQSARRQPDPREQSRAAMRDQGHEAHSGERDRTGQYL